MPPKKRIIATDETRVTVHIWRADSFWGGLYRHVTDRQRYCIGHIALQTYSHPDPAGTGALLPGKFINFLPPSEMTTILTAHFGKTPNQALSYQYRDDPKKFLALESPSVSIDLFSLNPRAIEAMYDHLHERERGFTWSAYSIPFFRKNSMSSTKLALWLLNAGMVGGLQLPPHISIPVLHEITLLWGKIKSFLCEKGIKIDLDKVTLGSALTTLLLEPASELSELFRSVIVTISSFTAVTSGECEAVVTYIQKVEEENGIEYIATAAAPTHVTEERGDVSAGTGAGIATLEEDLLDPENFHSVTGLRK